MGLLRLLLSLSVIAAHCGAFFGKTYLVRGFLAVQVFFMVSGFYMSLILNEKYTGANRSYRLFISNRFLRIYPLYWVVLLLSIAGGIFLYRNGGSNFFPVVKNYTDTALPFFTLLLLILIQVLLLGMDALMFTRFDAGNNLAFTAYPQDYSPGASSFLFVSPAWSLALEVLFYLLAPFVLRKKAGIVAGIILASITLRIYLYNVPELQSSAWAFRFFPTELALFLSGYFSYRLYTIIRTKKFHVNTSRLFTLALVGFMVVYLYLPDYKLSFLPYSFKEIILFVSMLLSMPLLFHFYKDNKTDFILGELSYPVYLLHWLVYVMLSYFAGQNSALAFLNDPLAVALVSIAFSLVLIKYISNPIDRFRQSRLKRERQRPLAHPPL
ncbi:MAG: acyltransferase [Sphingobacteriales bacterium]|nr:MAG: acyltransferase [Sphingobacteriales bacterium]